MFRQAKLARKADLIRRVWIPKPDSTERRPLGIPTMHDRAKQGLALLALEPEWEAYFEPNSYGFRPGRSAHDAIEAIHSSINKKPKYVLIGDIRKCFDRINHQFLIEKLDTYPLMKRQVSAWLKAGIMDKEEERTLFPSTGTPQGGVLSPLLSNIGLHGIEEELGKWISSKPAYNPSGTLISSKNRRSRLILVRYADDFRLLHPDLDVIKEGKERISELLKPMGLELNPEKSGICHTLLTSEGKGPGFKFLGFWIRNYPVGTPEEKRRKAGYRTYIRPHPDNISRVLRGLGKRSLPN
jgi:RNA-directed DNA polymerase